jgi:hypothetical protein
VIDPLTVLALFNVTLTSPDSMDETYVALALIPVPVTCMPVKMPAVVTYTMLWPEVPVPATTTPVAVVTVMVAVEVYPEPVLVMAMLEKLRLANTGVPVAVTPPAMLGALNVTVVPAEKFAPVLEKLTEAIPSPPMPPAVSSPKNFFFIGLPILFSPLEKHGVLGRTRLDFRIKFT